MSEILEKAKSHFRERLEGGMESVEVPEWGVTIHFKPETLRQRAAVHKAAQTSIADGLVEKLIQRALDADGKPLFKGVHRTELLREVDPDVVTRICMAMNRTDTLILGEIEGN